MDAKSEQWIVMGPSASPQEEQALTAVRSLLNDQSPAGGYSIAGLDRQPAWSQMWLNIFPTVVAVTWCPGVETNKGRLDGPNCLRAV